MKLPSRSVSTLNRGWYLSTISMMDESMSPSSAPKANPSTLSRASRRRFSNTDWSDRSIILTTIKTTAKLNDESRDDRESSKFDEAAQPRSDWPVKKHAGEEASHEGRGGHHLADDAPEKAAEGGDRDDA